jgi:hypothetical protein
MFEEGRDMSAPRYANAPGRMYSIFSGIGGFKKYYGQLRDRNERQTLESEIKNRVASSRNGRKVKITLPTVPFNHHEGS